VESLHQTREQAPSLVEQLKAERAARHGRQHEEESALVPVEEAPNGSYSGDGSMTLQEIEKQMLGHAFSAPDSPEVVMEAVTLPPKSPTPHNFSFEPLPQVHQKQTQLVPAGRTAREQLAALRAQEAVMNSPREMRWCGKARDVTQDAGSDWLRQAAQAAHAGVVVGLGNYEKQEPAAHQPPPFPSSMALRQPPPFPSSMGAPKAELPAAEAAPAPGGQLGGLTPAETALIQALRQRKEFETAEMLRAVQQEEVAAAMAIPAPSATLTEYELPVAPEEARDDSFNSMLQSLEKERNDMQAMREQTLGASPIRAPKADKAAESTTSQYIAAREWSEKNKEETKAQQPSENKPAQVAKPTDESSLVAQLMMARDSGSRGSHSVRPSPGRGDDLLAGLI